MVKSKADILEAIKKRIGEDSSDEALSFLEDVTDTLNDYDEKAKGDGTDWKSKYEENDKQWRDRYRERFFSGSSDNDKELLGAKEPPKKEEETEVTIDDLFTEKGAK